MMDIETGTQIGTVDCPGCGTALPLKRNTAGGIYFFCAKAIGTNEKTGKVEKCMTRLNFGRTASRRMIAEFLENKKDTTENAEHQNREVITSPGIGHNGGPPINDIDAGTLAIAAEQPAGFIDGLRRFLTE